MSKIKIAKLILSILQGCDDGVIRDTLWVADSGNETVIEFLLHELELTGHVMEYGDHELMKAELRKLIAEG